MNGNFRIFLAVAGLVMASLACQTVMGDGGLQTPPETQNPPETQTPQEPQPAVLLSDDFSSSYWGTGTDADSSVEYSNEALQIIVFTKNYFVWSTPDAESYQNIHMEVDVINNDTASTTAFGFLCHLQGDVDSFYYLLMTPAGEYAIAKATEGQDDVFLTNDDQWGASDLIPQNSPSYRVGVDCGNNTLTLYVNDQKIDSVTDSTYTSGGVGLVVWSGEEATQTNVSFDNFLMTELP